MSNNENGYNYSNPTEGARRASNIGGIKIGADGNPVKMPGKTVKPTSNDITQTDEFKELFGDAFANSSPTPPTNTGVTIVHVQKPEVPKQQSDNSSDSHTTK